MITTSAPSRSLGSLAMSRDMKEGVSGASRGHSCRAAKLVVVNSSQVG